MCESFKGINNQHGAKVQVNPATLAEQLRKLGKIPDTIQQPTAMDNLESMPSWRRRTRKSS